MKIIPFVKPDDEQTLTAQLVPCEGPLGGVDLAIVDRDGEPENRIVNLSALGLTVYADVAEFYDLPLNDRGCVKVRYGCVGCNPTDYQPSEDQPSEDAEAVRRAIKNVRYWLTDDSAYRDNTSLDNCDDNDTEAVTVGQLRVIIAALEKRL